MFLHSHPCLSPYLFCIIPCLIGSISIVSTTINSPQILHSSSKILSASTILPTLLFNQVRIAINDAFAICFYCMKLIMWPFKLMSIMVTCQALVPILLFLIILMRKPPDPSMDFWNKKTNKLPKQPPTILYGRKHCLYSSLNSVNTNDYAIFPISDQWKNQVQYFNDNTSAHPIVPRIPNRLYSGCKYVITRFLDMELSGINSIIEPLIRKYLLGMKYILPSNASMHFSSPSTTATSYCLTTHQIDSFIDIRDRFQSYISAFNATPFNCSGVLDNSANVHVIKDRSLFIREIVDCPLGLDVGTVVGSNAPQGIGTARIT